MGRTSVRLFLTVSGRGDLVVEAGPEVTIAQFVSALGAPGPIGAQTLRVERSGALLAPSRPVADMDLRSGDRVTLVDIGPHATLDDGPDRSTRPTATLRILTGPLAGGIYPLPPGTSTVGRASSNDLVLADPGLSRRHAVLTVDDQAVVVTDLGATNGVRIEGLQIDGPTALRSGQRLLLGQSWVAIDHHPVPIVPREGRIFFDRPQRFASGYRDRAFRVPAPPPLPGDGGLGPLAGRLHERRLEAGYEQLIDRVVADLAMARREEREARMTESPSLDEVVLAARAQTRLWERRLTDPDVLQVRLGLAEMPSRHLVEVEPGGAVALRTRVDRLPRTYATIDGVPATVDLGRPGGLVLRGSRHRLRPVAASVVGQLVGLNPPDQLGVVLFGDAYGHWDWLKWLPHADVLGNGRPPTGDEVVELVAALLDADPDGPSPIPARPPFLVVVVDDSTLGERSGSSQGGPSELARLLVKGAERGLHPLLLVDEAQHIPLVSSGLSGATLTVEGATGRLAIRGEQVQVMEPVILEPAGDESLVELGRLLAPLIMRPPAPLDDPRPPPEPQAPDEPADDRPRRAADELTGDPTAGWAVHLPTLDLATFDLPPAEPMADPAAADPAGQQADPTAGEPGEGDDGSTPDGSERLVIGSLHLGPAPPTPTGPPAVAATDPAAPAQPGRPDGPDPATLDLGGEALDLFDLPRAQDDARLVLGSYRSATNRAEGAGDAGGAAGSGASGGRIDSGAAAAAADAEVDAAAAADAEVDPDVDPGVGVDIDAAVGPDEPGAGTHPGLTDDDLLAFEPPRDGTLGLVGPPEAAVGACLVTVAAAATRIDQPVATLPMVHWLGPGPHLASLTTLPVVRAVAGDAPDPAMAVLTELEQLMGDRLLTFDLAGVHTIDEFRRARPAVTMRRALVLIDGLARLTQLLEPSHPGRTREVVGQLLELGPNLGVHLVFTVADRGEVDATLAPKVGRWLTIGDADGPGHVQLYGAEARFAALDGSWSVEATTRGLTRLSADLAERADRVDGRAPAGPTDPIDPVGADTTDRTESPAAADPAAAIASTDAVDPAAVEPPPDEALGPGPPGDPGPPPDPPQPEPPLFQTELST